MNSNNAIGGYFEMPISDIYKNVEGYDYALNSGNNALLLLLKESNVRSVHLPYYTCGNVIDALQKNGIDINFYHITDYLEIKETLMPDKVIIYNNYFGIKDKYIASISKKYSNLIIDNAQALFSLPPEGISAFYSPRKFVGLPDGGFIKTAIAIDIGRYDVDISYDRMSHLLKRLDVSPEFGYNDFAENNAALNERPINKMSKLTSILFNSINLKYVKEKRKENFHYLHSKLSQLNKLIINIEDEDVPMVYPFWINNGNEVRQLLNDNRIFTATYWSDVQMRVKKDSLEDDLVKNLVAIPIDSRYSLSEMDIIISTIH